ncbi:MAG: DUF3800 domain-containing protein [Candidatus Diapherotrites archaeon]|nr:DUF3800 domain-containing protein [Candidatus Diapherotrites archaeon]
MLHIFLDESGDTGFKKSGSSKFFVITILLTRDELGIKRAVKRVRQRKLKKKMKQLPEIKANNSSDTTRRRFLTDLAGLDIDVLSIILSKDTVYEYLRSKQTKLYHYLANLILNECSLTGEEVHLIVDKRERKRLVRDDFDDYIKRNNNQCKTITVSHFGSKNSAGLQAVDFLSWAVFRKYESSDGSYYSLIKDKIITEKKLFE